MTSESIRRETRTQIETNTSVCFTHPETCGEISLLPSTLRVSLRVSASDMRVSDMKLTDKECINAKAKTRLYKLSDGQSLYLQIEPNGSKLWRYGYRYMKKHKTLALGVYPDVSLKDAREKHQAARKLLQSGKDPSAEKKLEKLNAELATANTFEQVAREWHERRKPLWSEKHANNVMCRMETDIFPRIGPRPIAEILPTELLLTVLRKIEERGAIDIAHRARGIAGEVFRYGVATGRCERDITVDLRDALRSTRTQHFAAIDTKELPDFLKTLDRNEARLYPRTRRAMRMLMMTFVRTYELIGAQWEEFDLEEAQWVIPAERMKMKRDHIVPLSRQTLELLEEQRLETGHFNTPWVFPSLREPRNHMSNNTILVALKRLGYQGKMTGHGFRALAMSTIKEKLGYEHEVVDRQLSHLPRRSVDRAYNRAQYLDQRSEMMQAWADYLDRASGISGDNVVHGKFKNMKSSLKIKKS